jgi:hypothetical protein
MKTYKSWLLILAALVLGFITSEIASAQDCKNGVCSLPGAVREVVSDVVSVPVNTVHKLQEARPVRKVVLRPFRLFRSRCR